MWIRRDKYERLLRLREENLNLRKDIKRLAEMVSAETESCKVGAWCEDCKYIAYTRHTPMNMDLSESAYSHASDGRVMYCKKHLAEICAEFEWRSNRTK